MILLVSVYDMVPFLKVVLGTTLSVMGMTKQDNMKWVFSSGEGVFILGSEVAFTVNADP